MGESPLVRRRVVDVLIAVGYLGESVALALLIVAALVRVFG